ncbi:MAG: hypothetical protein ACO3EZ_06330, partial [Prochlorotrichaceae cyanobacterium]
QGLARALTGDFAGAVDRTHARSQANNPQPVNFSNVLEMFYDDTHEEPGAIPAFPWPLAFLRLYVCPDFWTL